MQISGILKLAPETWHLAPETCAPGTCVSNLPSHGILFVHFYLFIFFVCLEATLGKDTFTTNSDFHQCYGNFSKKPLRKLLDHNYVKVFFNNYKAHLQQHLERRSTIKDSMGMDQETCGFFHQETKINLEGALKIITRKKCNLIFQRTLHRNRLYFTCYYTLLFISRKSSY